MNVNRRGLTLLEVVFSLLLLGTLLVMLLVGYSRQAAQIERASERLRVMEAAEVQLAQWHLQFGFAPTSEAGEFQIGDKLYRWQTRPVDQTIDRRFLLGKIAFNVFSMESDTLVLSLELVVPAWEMFE